MKKLDLIIAILFIFLLSACSSASPTPLAPQPASPTAAEAPTSAPTLPPQTGPQASQQAGVEGLPTSTEQAAVPQGSPTTVPSPTPASTATPAGPTPSPTPDTRPVPYYWRDWPTIPALSGTARAAFQRGQYLGMDSHVFTRVGDCQSVPEVFLGIYGTDRYWFSADYQHLEQTVGWFRPSFLQESVAARDGFGVASVFSTLMSDPAQCQASETPLDCEFRLRKPAFVFIAMGTNWAPNASASFEKYLTQTVQYSLDHGAIPILLTKADNIEQDYALNESIARVAYDQDVPLYNAWRAVQWLPNHGLDEDGIYLTPDAWDARNFGALETLDSLLRDLEMLEP